MSVRETAEQKLTSTAIKSSLPWWVCVGLSYFVVFLVEWNRFCFLWRPGVIKHISEGRKMISAEMGSRHLEQQLQTLQIWHDSGQARTSKVTGLRFMSMDLC